MAQKPLETGLSDMPEEAVTNVIAFTPSGLAPSGLPEGHSAEILPMTAQGSSRSKDAAGQEKPN